MRRNENKSIYQLGRFIKLRKQWGFVNTKCNVNVQIIFKTKMPLHKLDTSIICCSVIVSTWDVSRKQIGDAADLAARRHGRWEGTVNCERTIHQGGSCFVCNWRSQRNQNIIISPKMCLFKLKTLENKKFTFFLKNYAGIDSKHPQTIGSTREREGYGDPGPWPPMVAPSDLNQLCTWTVLNDGKIQISNFLR